MIVPAAAISDAAAAQVPPPRPKPVDQAVEDVGALSSTLRETQVDLRQSNGFQQVYRVPGRQDLLMRSSGGVHAVFPRSQYARHEHGLAPLIPPDTVFYIGLPALWAAQKSAPDAAIADELKSQPTRIRSRIGWQIQTTVADDALEQAAGSAAIDTEILDSHPSPQTPIALPIEPSARELLNGERAAGQPSGPTLANNSEYRARRIDALMQRAALAHKISTQQH